MSRLELRPHHGLCLLFYEGRGYSPGFTAHMDAVAASLRRDPAVILRAGCDTLCRRCPHRAEGCPQAARYDSRVLALCGLSWG